MIDNYISEKIKRKHVKQQVREVRMQKSRTEHPDLFPSPYATDIEFIFLKKGHIIKPFHRNDYVGDNDDDYCEMWNLHIK